MPCSPSRLVATLAAVVVATAIGSGTASAATVTKTVPAEYAFVHGQKPTDPGNCSAIAFAQWADVPGTIAATAHYTSLSNGSWGERTESRNAPFDDTYTWVTTYTVPSGSHWIALGKAWRDGPGVDDCSAGSVRQQAFYRPPVSVELTIEEAPACVAVRSSATKATAAIASLKRQLKHASGKRKAALRKKLNRARSDLQRAQAGIKTRCP
jgi:hypothetical protein